MTADDDRELEALMGALQEAAEQVDVPPGAVLEAGRAALSIRRLDDELAVLLSDSDLSDSDLAAAPVRGDGVRLLSFAAADVTVELQVEHLEQGVSVRGVVTGATGPAVIETPAGSRSFPLDADGWFIATGLPAVASRLRLGSPEGSSVVTGWVLW